MRNNDVIGQIFDILKRIESYLSLLKLLLVQKAISDKQSGTATLVNMRNKRWWAD
jgi:hypothetical protein